MEIQIFGERNSGTHYVRNMIKHNINCKVVKDNGWGWTHTGIGTRIIKWLDDEAFEFKLINPKPVPKNHLIIVVYRNIFTWLQSMYYSPHNAPAMHGIDFGDFLTKEWKSHLCPGDPKFYSGINLNDFEELENYKSIFDLRESKIKLFNSYQYKYNTLYIQYEAFKEFPTFYIWVIKGVLRTTLKNKEVENITLDKFLKKQYKKKTYNLINENNINVISSLINWNIEELAGYDKNKTTKMYLKGET